jgi:hypothetical protein
MRHFERPQETYRVSAAGTLTPSTVIEKFFEPKRPYRSYTTTEIVGIAAVVVDPAFGATPLKEAVFAAKAMVGRLNANITAAKNAPILTA